MRGVALVLLLALASCTSARAPDGHPAIASVHERQCGSCHEPPEPKTRSRTQIESAMLRHKSRLRLAPAEWHAMIDYLTAVDSPK